MDHLLSRSFDTLHIFKNPQKLYYLENKFSPPPLKGGLSLMQTLQCKLNIALDPS